MYRYVDAALLRATASPSGLVFPPPPEPSHAPADIELWQVWIKQVWAQESIAEAVELASPTLARSVHRLCTGAGQLPKQVRRTGLSLHRYLLRLQHRATPFGVFAGVTRARVGPALRVRWGEEHRAMARADAVWLAEMIARLEACPDLLRRLPVMADSTCFVRGQRLVVPCQQQAHDDQRGPGEVNVRRTRAVETVVAAAATPVMVSDLTELLASAYPDTPREVIDALLAELVARRVLLTALRPPMTVTDTLGYVIDQLSAANAEQIPAAAPTARALREIQTMLARHATARRGNLRAVRALAIETMTAQTTVVAQPLAVDLRLDCSLTLPYEVAREAEQAVDLLARLTPVPAGSRAWQEYHARFLERWGAGAVVPLLHLTDPDTGLDFPAGYRGSRMPRPVAGLTARDEYLLALAQRAACDGTREVVLTDTVLSDLASTPVEVPLPHIDLRFQLQASTQQALDQGSFTLLVTGVTPAAGASAGRFLDLLDQQDRDQMIATYDGLPSLDGAALRAQVSSPPLDVRTENVGRAPALLSQVISLAEYRRDRTLPLEDLAVTADATRMSLMSLSTGRPVEPTVMSAVDLANFTHPLARLLCELPRSGAAAFGPFAWGAASRLPFLPRIRRGRTILAPASWRIAAADLAEPGASFTEWMRSLTAWRKRFRLPAVVLIGNDDRCLRLDLGSGADAALLRTELDRANHVTMREAPDAAAGGWFGGRAHEITLAFASTRAPVPCTPTGRATRPAPVDRDHGHLPGGSSWAFAKLYGHPDRVSEILTDHLPHLWDRWDEPPGWWFVRYRDPRDHLRLRFRLPNPEAFEHVARRVGEWAADLRHAGLLGLLQWDTYFPETGRFGAGEAMSAAETVFAADSIAAVAELSLITTSATSPQAVITASLVDLAASVAGDLGTGMRWLIDHFNTDTLPHPTRPVRQDALRLASPHNSFAALRELAGGARVVTAWAARQRALEGYRAELAAGGELRPETVLPSLLHLHHLRAAGIDEANEHICLRLARSAALAWTARQEGASM